MNTGRRVVLATHNAHKSAELQAMLGATGIQVLPLSQFTTHSPDETGLTFIENALIKARHAARVSGLPAIADDSGIAVDALRGAPGVHSARFAGERASDVENLQKLLRELGDIDEAQRSARYHCALVYLQHELDPAPVVCHATWEGRIAHAPRGSGGFGYDPIFIIAGRDVTAAEIPAAEKNRISHRALALQELLPRLAKTVCA